MTMTEPGWYPEPGNPGLTRYWDGQQWTPETRRNFADAPTRHSHARHGGSVSPVGLIVLVVGAAGVILAFTALNWFHFDDYSDAYKTRYSFSDLSGDSTIPGFASAYFSWLGWVLLAATAALAVAACVPTSSRDTFRYLGFAAGVAGVAATLGALITLEHRVGISASDFASAFGPGPWLAMIAFLVVGLAAMLGQLGDRLS